MNLNTLRGWVPSDVMHTAVPLTEEYKGKNYKLHFYEGFDPSIAISICEDLLMDVILADPVDIYLYIIDYPHDHSRLDRQGSNNGYTQIVGQHYSIVIFRKLFWPKVLIHELLHVLWFLNQMPIVRDFPRWDEAIIEAHAVRIAIQKNYINEKEYMYYLRQSKKVITDCVGGDIMTGLKNKQETHVYEYIFLSEAINGLLKCHAKTANTV